MLTIIKKCIYKFIWNAHSFELYSVGCRWTTSQWWPWCTPSMTVCSDWPNLMPWRTKRRWILNIILFDWNGSTIWLVMHQKMAKNKCSISSENGLEGQNHSWQIFDIFRLSLSQVDCLVLQLHRIGDQLEKMNLQLMDELFNLLRDGFLLQEDLSSMGRLLLLEILEFRAGGWTLSETAQKYYYSEVTDWGLHQSWNKTVQWNFNPWEPSVEVLFLYLPLIKAWIFTRYEVWHEVEDWSKLDVELGFCFVLLFKVELNWLFKLVILLSWYTFLVL